MKIDVKFKWGTTDLQMFKQIKEPIETYKIETNYLEVDGDLIYAIVDEIYNRHGIVCHNDVYVKSHIVDYDKIVRKLF